MKKIRILLLLLAVLLLFSACNRLPALKQSEAGYLYGKDKTPYQEAPMNYLAVKRSKTAVARLVDTTGEWALYSAGQDFLCDESGTLYAPEGTVFPALSAFAATRVNLCKEESVRVELASSTDEELLLLLTNAFAMQDTILTRENLPQGFDSSRYLLLLLSESYPNFCFQLEYLVFEKGDDPYAEWPYETDAFGFLYQRDVDRCAVAPLSLYDLLSGGNS